MAINVRQGNALMSLSFKANLDELRRDLPDWAGRRIDSITRNALNDAVVEGVFAEQDKIRGIFDRPTPLTQKAVLYRRATSDSLTAWVFIRDEAAKGTPPSKYLMPQVLGGPRGAKRFEAALRAIGVLEAGEFAVPAAGYKRDAYGNVPGSTIVAILSQLKAHRDVGYMMNETRPSADRNRKSGKARYFVPSGYRSGKAIGRLPRGIYERRGKTMRAVFMFVRQPRYRKRYDFGQAATAKVNRVFWAYWQRHFYRELAKQTAR